MSYGRYDRPLDELLEGLAGASVVKDPGHRHALTVAARAVQEIFANQERVPA